MKNLFIPFVILILFVAGCSHSVSIVQSEASLLKFTIRGDSMEPTLKNGDLVELDFGFYQNNPIQRNDLIAFKLKTVRKPYVKRVVALPGDKIEFQDGELFINDRRQVEDFLNSEIYIFSTEDLKIISRTLNASNNTVPSNSYFVLSDNRIRKEDSRKFGFLPRQRIIGKVFPPTVRE